MDYVTDEYLTLEHQNCCVTLAAIKNLSRLSAGISIHGIATEDFTINLGSKDCEVLFVIFLWPI